MMYFYNKFLNSSDAFTSLFFLKYFFTPKYPKTIMTPPAIKYNELFVLEDDSTTDSTTFSTILFSVLSLIYIIKYILKKLHKIFIFHKVMSNEINELSKQFREIFSELDEEIITLILMSYDRDTN
jgi:hypothetical protein